jgi:hypothetical protein
VSTSVFGAVAVVYGFSAAEHSSWTSPLTVGSIAVGVALLAVFVVIETRVSDPVLPMQVVMDRNPGRVPGRRSDRGGRRPVARTGPRAIVVTALGTVLFTGLTSDSGYADGVLLELVVIGAGFGLVFGPARNLATYGAAPSQAGAASAVVNAGQQLGAAIGTALLNTIAVSGAAGYLVGPIPAGSRSGRCRRATKPMP